MCKDDNAARVANSGKKAKIDVYKGYVKCLVWKEIIHFELTSTDRFKASNRKLIFSKDIASIKTMQDHTYL